MTKKGVGSYEVLIKYTIPTSRISSTKPSKPKEK